MTNKPEISLEFFPPKTEQGVANLNDARSELDALAPSFYSVTFGAGGSTREGTYDAVKSIIDAGGDAAPHISCIGASKKSIRELLEGYSAIGVKRLVALRGDRPSGMVELGDFAYANELVEFIRAEMGDRFLIEVAAYPEYHPESSDPATDLANFKRKVDAGAHSAITQYFFNADAYFALVDSAMLANIEVPIVPGIMPITNFVQLARFSDMCGAEIPRWLRSRLEQYQHDADSLQDFGAEVITTLCDCLLEGGAPGIHFYTLNKASPTIEICKRLELI
ncbi:MAG TPA: methylenetetrahydrofolate reductase [NAD(P)H] [Gammaproteobacteria bacterium]|jgi:methylenetetrahydrofolate reductase (NADPH)|nr:methylenetetrahydrofolate reductase [NAD(P)H] [Pseudomonadota bacterium]HAY46555.1 methylenetetrahydrofolate reductase [NAD(P)H] [Gammaproteobacteria bacterium]